MNFRTDLRKSSRSVSSTSASWLVSKNWDRTAMLESQPCARRLMSYRVNLKKWNSRTPSSKFKIWVWRLTLPRQKTSFSNRPSIWLSATRSINNRCSKLTSWNLSMETSRTPTTKGTDSWTNSNKSSRKSLVNSSKRNATSTLLTSRKRRSRNNSKFNENRWQIKFCNFSSKLCLRRTQERYGSIGTSRPRKLISTLTRSTFSWRASYKRLHSNTRIVSKLSNRWMNRKITSKHKYRICSLLSMIWWYKMKRFRGRYRLRTIWSLRSMRATRSRCQGWRQTSLQWT